MFKIWLEWDYGHDDIAFTTKEKAIQWVNGLKIEDYDNPEKFLTFQDLEDEGLCGIIELIIDPIL